MISAGMPTRREQKQSSSSLVPASTRREEVQKVQLVRLLTDYANVPAGTWALGIERTRTETRTICHFRLFCNVSGFLSAREGWLRGEDLNL